VVIFSYTGLPQVKISQKVLGGGATFLTRTVDFIFNSSMFCVCLCCLCRLGPVIAVEFDMILL